MPPVTLAVTHTTLTADEELHALAGQWIAIGTAIRDRARHEVSAAADNDLCLLERLGSHGGFAIATFPKNGGRYLCAFTPKTSVTLTNKLRTLRFSQLSSLPESLKGINTIGLALRELTGSEHQLVMRAVDTMRWRAT